MGQHVCIGHGLRTTTISGGYSVLLCLLTSGGVLAKGPWGQAWGGYTVPQPSALSSADLLWSHSLCLLPDKRAGGIHHPETPNMSLSCSRWGCRESARRTGGWGGPWSSVWQGNYSGNFGWLVES